MISSFRLHQTVLGESHASSDEQNIKLRDFPFRVPPNWLSWPHERIQEHYVFVDGKIPLPASATSLLFMFQTTKETAKTDNRWKGYIVLTMTNQYNLPG